MTNLITIIKAFNDKPYPIGISIIPKSKVIGKLINGVLVEYEISSEGIKTNENYY